MESNTPAGMIFDFGSLYAHIRSLADRRKAKGLRYELALILVLLVMAKICGEDRPSGIAEWAKHRAGMLVEMLSLKRKAMPHHSTYRRILAEVVCVEELEQISQTYLLAAYLPGEGIVLMEVAFAGKGREQEAAPRVLKSMDLREKVVMGDALHTQRDILTQTVEAGGEYIWLAKGNQPQLEDNIRLWFEPDVQPIPGMSFPPTDFETAQATSKGHGRLEKRTSTVSSQLKDYLDWPYLEQVFKLERRSTSLKTGEIREQVVYGITSLAREEITLDKLLHMTRFYWGIENGLHYRRDVTLREDYTRMTKGRAGQAMACLNNLILGI